MFIVVGPVGAYFMSYFVLFIYYCGQTAEEDGRTPEHAYSTSIYKIIIWKAEGVPKS